MGAGDLTWSGSAYCDTDAEIEAAVEGIVLSAATDTIHIIPWRNGCIVGAVIRAAS